MGVVFKGGPSGNREDGIPSIGGAVMMPVAGGGNATGKNAGVNMNTCQDNRHVDGTPNIAVPFDPQPPQDTSSKGGVPGTVHLPDSKSTHPGWNDATPDFLPSGGSPDDGAR